ncbi:MAG: phosphoribosylanthranilate isomerase [Thermoflavifilum sp.]|nr:phosphoribosylanthranilate isomerase [Thermoflavifilum sp.]
MLPKRLHIKVCGFTQLHELPMLEAMGVDFFGMIFYPRSPRYIRNFSQQQAARAYTGSMKKVGVFVDAPLSEIWRAADEYGLQVIQLHGEEPPEWGEKLREQGFQVIKTFHLPVQSPSSPISFPDIRVYETACDYVLFDTASMKKGGSGQRFAWQALQAYAGNKPFFLSGGISPNHVTDIWAIDHPQLFAVDINSRFEIAPGIKNLELIKQFICQLNIVSEA